MIRLKTIFFSGFIIPPPPPPRVNLPSSTHGSSYNNNQAKFNLSGPKPKPDQSNATKFELSAPRASKSVVDAPKTSNDSVVSSASSTSYSTLPKVSFTDREIQEIRVAKETFFKEPKEKISPRIASIQKMLASSGNQVKWHFHKRSRTAYCCRKLESSL